MCLEVCASLPLPSILLAFRQVCVSSNERERGMGEDTQVQGTQIYGCTVYHGVSLLPHKLGDTGPPLISLFNLRVVTSFEMYNVCNSSSIPQTFRHRFDRRMILLLCYDIIGYRRFFSQINF